MPKVLLVDDDIQLGSRVKEWLETADKLKVEFVNTGEDAIQMLNSFGFDLIILDWNLPGISGLRVCEQYRKSGGTTPILFLTGRNDISDKEAGFDQGGDDYLSKPFHVKELSMRCMALLRRARLPLELADKNRKLVLKQKERSLLLDDKEIPLTKLECALLEFMLRHPGKQFSAVDLLKHVWPSDKSSSEDAVRNLVRNFRKKLSEFMGNESYTVIDTVQGGGYVYKPDVLGSEHTG